MTCEKLRQSQEQIATDWQDIKRVKLISQELLKGRTNMNKLIPDESTLGLSMFKTIPAVGSRILQIPQRSLEQLYGVKWRPDNCQ